jgi:hypothetical protein
VVNSTTVSNRFLTLSKLALRLDFWLQSANTSSRQQRQEKGWVFATQNDSKALVPGFVD